MLESVCERVSVASAAASRTVRDHDDEHHHELRVNPAVEHRPRIEGARAQLAASGLAAILAAP